MCTSFYGAELDVIIPPTEVTASIITALPADFEQKGMVLLLRTENRNIHSFNFNAQCSACLCKCNRHAFTMCKNDNSARSRVSVLLKCSAADNWGIEYNYFFLEDWNTFVKLNNGDVFGCDLIVSAIGVDPNSELWTVDNPTVSAYRFSYLIRSYCMFLPISLILFYNTVRLVCLCRRHGHVFSVGEGSDLRLGGGGIYPPNSQKFRLRRAKRKRSRGFSEKFFTTWKKLPYPPTSFGRRYGGPWGVHTPIPPTPMSALSIVSALGRLVFRDYLIVYPFIYERLSEIYFAGTVICSK